MYRLRAWMCASELIKRFECLGSFQPKNQRFDKIKHRVVKARFYFQCHVDKQIKLHLMVPACGLGDLRVS